MNPKDYSVSTMWDSRYMDAKTKVSRVLLSVNFSGQQFRISIKVKCTKAEWQSAANTRSTATKDLRKTLNGFIEKAEAILDRMPSPSKEMFLKLYKSELDLSTDKTSLHLVYKLRVEELMMEKRFGTAHSLKAAYNALLRFKLTQCKIQFGENDKIETLVPKVELFFEEVDERFLKQFKSYLLDKGRSNTTCGIYLGYLRALYNYAIEQGILAAKDPKNHPFVRIKIGTTARTKSVLYADDIRALWNYQPVGIREERAKAMWFFLYLCNGMNFKDACYIKWKNIKGDILTFVREKTKNTSASAKEISLHLHEEAKKIIEQYGDNSHSPDDFVFPMLKNCRDLRHMEETRHRHKRVFNNKLAAIGQRLGFQVHLCLNLARHSFATTLKVNGTPAAFISEAMGHTSLTTTQHYLKSLPTEQLKQISSSLMQFNHPVSA